LYLAEEFKWVLIDEEEQKEKMKMLIPIIVGSYQQLKRYEHELEQLSSLEAQSTSTPSAS